MKNMLVFVALIILCVSCGVENDADWDAGDVAGDVEELTNCGEVYGCGNNVPLYYSTEGVDVEVSMVDAPFGFTAEKLMAMADECGTTYEPGYFEALVKTFTDTDIGGVKLQFVFRYEGESQDSDLLSPSYRTIRGTNLWRNFKRISLFAMREEMLIQ